MDRVREWNAARGSGPCVTPRLLLLDNGYTSHATREDAGRPLEVAAPAGAVAAVQGQRSATARQALATAVQRASAGVGCGDTAVPAVAHLYPVAHPGPQAPLGWTLSAYSRDDLREQLGSRHNACQAAVLRAWFDETSEWESACRPDD